MNESLVQVSSQNITVALRTSPLGATTTTGHYFGRFATGNWPSQGMHISRTARCSPDLPETGLPNPNPPVPNSLKVPNFSLTPGGFGVGKVATNLPVWITVIEEWNTCTVSASMVIAASYSQNDIKPTVGNNIYITEVQAVYNSTS
jgi:hypothetical protein